MMIMAGLFLAFQTMGTGTGSKNPPGKYDEILKLVGQMLSQAHYSPQDIDDAFSKKIFKKYLNDLDPDKTMYLQSDISSLSKKYETKIDDEIKGTPAEFFLAAGKVFNTRMEESSTIVNELLAKPFNFTIDEESLPDGEKLSYPSNAAEMKERWRKKIKLLVLERYADLIDTREKNKGKDSFVVKTDVQLEQEAREKTKKNNG